GRASVLVDLKELRLPPDLDAVDVHVERQVAEEMHAARVRVALQRGPRQLEQILAKSDRAKPLPLGRGELAQRAGAAAPEILGPLPPRRGAVPLPKQLEQRI